MREKCARVLAAALMTGAIGFALAMPAFFGTAHDTGRPLTAPPSFLQRSVHVVAPALPRSPRAGRLEETGPIRPASFVSVTRPASSHNGSTLASDRHSSTAGRSKLNPKPAPKPPTPVSAPAPTPASDTRGLSTNTPPAAVAPAAPAQPAQSAGDNGKGNGKGKGPDKNKGKGKPAGTTQPPAPAATPQPVSEPAPTEGEKEHGRDKDKDKDQSNGHNG